MHLQGLRRTIEDEVGQVLAFALVCMVVLIAMVGFAVDVGHAYLVQRQLQSGVDAAALAGAQELPDPTLVTTVAMNYGPNSTKNPPTAIDNAVTNVEMKCVTTAPGCSSSFNTYNAVKVTATSKVKTYFARILGIDSLKVNATATACSPCSSKPLDIMVVLDRTGSMCDVSSNGKVQGPERTRRRCEDVPRVHGPGSRRGRSRGLPALALQLELLRHADFGRKELRVQRVLAELGYTSVQ